MNNQDFENNFVALLLTLGVKDYSSRMYTVNPITEENKRYNEFDHMMKNFILPKTRALTYEQFINLFTIKEGYYPCWIKIINVNSEIVINTSLRMRKRKEIPCVGQYHPFSTEITMSDNGGTHD